VTRTFLISGGAGFIGSALAADLAAQGDRVRILDDLSMGPFFIPVIKRIIRSVSYAAARNIARDVLTMATVKEVKGHLFDGMKSFGIIELMDMYH